MNVARILANEEKKSLEEICWAVVYADVSYSLLLRRMILIQGSPKECPQKIRDGYFAVQEAKRLMSEVIKDYNLGTDVSLHSDHRPRQTSPAHEKSRHRRRKEVKTDGSERTGSR